MTSWPQSNASPIILQNAKDFLNVGLELLLDEASDNARIKVAIVSVQTSIELLAKYRLVRDYGVQSIIKGQMPSKPLAQAALAGDFRTLGYSDCLKKLREEEGFSEAEEELIREIQNLRNALVHFGGQPETDTVKMTIAWLLIRVLSMFAAGQERDIGEFQDHRSFLTEKNYTTLVSYDPYRAEALDVAADSLDSEKVFRCWQCKNDTLSLRPSETLFCYCCGLTVDNSVGAVGFCSCPRCGVEEGVFYDGLNSTNGFFPGMCMYCDCRVSVWSCQDCGYISPQTSSKITLTCQECGPSV